ncbi:hypothetical protein GLAREA_09069 [Glarea lozoyensis ATCC 20868]|uniref:MARVEL domain-containing protein n=2 Tax=Glarea lozoyensis TaxID=101852 RepID=S3DYA5_GLAL2|nr:uncharacterized protein GLAREA_09069 [Glarea lozoyensis ATCC 20868]EHK99107.1 hypothetical protein M7I_5048 [Glarea lozoyensis 74030]EPE36906.1 hypothetical protein GLAREA_09069 [Glarea lozoyensis ATCC 20868]
MGFKPNLEFSAAYIAHSAFRIIQIVLALTVVGLYGVDLHKANREHKYSDGKWVYAVVTASLSAPTALAYLIPFIHRIPFLFVWDSILFVLWIALFGIFGKMYIHENPEGNGGIKRMKNAVWVDLVNALLWLVSAVGMAGYWWRSRGTRTKWTGRARV